MNLTLRTATYILYAFEKIPLHIVSVKHIFEMNKNKLITPLFTYIYRLKKHMIKFFYN